jgi:hypothetical protein
MQTKKKFPWWVIILIVVVLCVLCVVVIAAGLVAIPWITERTQSPINDIVQTFVPEPTLQYEHNTLPEVTESFDPGPNPGLTGMQVYDGTYLYDDFSSDALGWPVANDEKSILQYENGQYSFQILQADEFDWTYPPIDFLATDVWFDVQGLPGDQNGTFGVFCQDQDIDNYYFAEFDLELRSYLVGVVTNGEFTYLTPENSDGSHWVDSNAIKSQPEQINRIGVTCYLDYISLYINDEWVDDFDVPNPFATEGDVALFVYAFDFADANGYKVFFDNVEIY